MPPLPHKVIGGGGVGVIAKFSLLLAQTYHHCILSHRCLERFETVIGEYQDKVRTVEEHHQITFDASQSPNMKATSNMMTITNIKTTTNIKTASNMKATFNIKMTANMKMTVNSCGGAVRGTYCMPYRSSSTRLPGRLLDCQDLLLQRDLWIPVAGFLSSNK